MLLVITMVVVLFGATGDYNGWCYWWWSWLWLVLLAMVLVLLATTMGVVLVGAIGGVIGDVNCCWTC